MLWNSVHWEPTYIWNRLFTSCSYTCFQWTEDGQGFQIQYLTLDTWPGSCAAHLRTELWAREFEFWCFIFRTHLNMHNIWVTLSKAPLRQVLLHETSGSSTKSQVLDVKTLPVFSPLKISVIGTIPGRFDQLNCWISSVVYRVSQKGIQS